MPWWEGSGGAFAVNIDFLSFTADNMLFYLRDVVRNVINQSHIELISSFSERFFERLSSPVCDHLSIDPSKVSG